MESVRNDLHVRILGGDGRDDAELRGDILQALMLDSFVPKTVDVRLDGKLQIPADSDSHRRVLAVLTYLEAR